jgi:anti-sigma factor ChrR (cupin superfamily)
MSNEQTAIAYVMGALSPAERDEVARERLYNAELDEHIHLAEQLFAGLQTAAAAEPLAASNWQGIEQALQRERSALAGKYIEECADGDWQEHGPRIEFKPLWSDSVILIRCNPGAVEAEHDQPADQDEHILVVAGDLDVGDYIRVPAGTLHRRMETHGGCLLFTEYRNV